MSFIPPKGGSSTILSISVEDFIVMLIQGLFSVFVKAHLLTVPLYASMNFVIITLDALDPVATELIVTLREFCYIIN